jgi:transposase
MTQITLQTGPERRRRWSEEERRRILAAAFTPGAVVADVARQLEVSTSLIYKWRQQAMAGETRAAFAPVVLAPGCAAAVAPPDTTAIIVELGNGARVRIGAEAAATLVTATLRALNRAGFAGGRFS